MPVVAWIFPIVATLLSLTRYALSARLSPGDALYFRLVWLPRIAFFVSPLLILFGWSEEGFRGGSDLQFACYELGFWLVGMAIMFFLDRILAKLLK